MKHVKLFEAFNEMGHKAISVFFWGDSSLYVGVFPSDVADSIYQEINSNPSFADGTDLAKIIDLPADHDVVVSLSGGEGLSTTSSADFSGPLVKLGEQYEYTPSNDDLGIPFLADRNINGFVCINHVGETEFVSMKDMRHTIKNGGNRHLKGDME